MNDNKNRKIKKMLEFGAKASQDNDKRRYSTGNFSKCNNYRNNYNRIRNKMRGKMNLKAIITKIGS